MTNCVYATAGWGIHDARWVAALRTLGHEPAIVSLASEHPTEHRKVADGVQAHTPAELRALVADRSAGGEPVLTGPLPTIARQLVGLPTRVVGLSWGFDLHDLAAADDTAWLAGLDGIVVDSEPTRAIALAAGIPAEAITYLPWGIDLSVFTADGDHWLPAGAEQDEQSPTTTSSAKQGEPQRNETPEPAAGLRSERIVLSLRAHEPLYRVSDIIAAFAQVVPAVPDARLVVGHSGSLTDDLRKQADGLGIADRVTFVGTVDEPHLAPLLRTTDCYVTASEVDGTSVTMLQAMACGAPVVASATPGNLDWIDDRETGRTFPTGDIAALADAIVATLRSDPTAMTERARAEVTDRADWQRNLPRLDAALFGTNNAAADEHSLDTTASHEPQTHNLVVADPPSPRTTASDTAVSVWSPDALPPARSLAVVIPAFRPDVSALVALVRSLGDLPVLVVDDGSPDAGYLDAIRDLGTGTGAGTSQVETIRHAANAGIARSLNDGLRFATERGARWLLTVDQDTTLPTDYVASLFAAIPERALDRIGAIGVETIGDADGDLRYPARIDGDVLVTEEVFQTGTLWNVDEVTRIGGFDEDFGIDAVDAAACLGLRERGFVIALAPGTRLEHSYGTGRHVRLLGRTVVATGHSPKRRETMVRNRTRLFRREFRQSPAHALRTMRRLGVNVLLGVTVEDDRWEKAKAAARGLLPKRSA